MRAGIDAFLVAGDAYRRDEIDATHYPAFHQMEGVKVWPTETDSYEKDINLALDHLKTTLEVLAKDVFGNDVEMRWNDDYFPFTDPSVELEIKYQGDWMEILGAGVMTPTVIGNAGINSRTNVGWAFGLGLERWAMKLFEIPDIRLFWSNDSRFLEQFSA